MMNKYTNKIVRSIEGLRGDINSLNYDVAKMTFDTTKETSQSNVVKKESGKTQN